MAWGTCSTYVKVLMEEVKTILNASKKTNLKAIAADGMVFIGYQPGISDRSIMIMPGDIDWSKTRNLQKRVQLKIAVVTNMRIGTVDEYQYDMAVDMLGEVIDELTSDTNGTTTTGWFIKDKITCVPRVTSKSLMMYEMTINYYWGP